MSEVYGKTGKTCFTLLLAPISLHVVSQKVLCYCGNVKTKYFSVLKSFCCCLFGILTHINVVTVMVWFPENLFPVGQINNLLELSGVFFFSLLSNSNLHLCKAEKKKSEQ